ncbi:MAG: TRAP-type transport system periplasmic protein [Halanaerobiales bacterium]|nr:TRAP-type transport system periplasmic protein [Halanaerobiales bacterium]
MKKGLIITLTLCLGLLSSLAFIVSAADAPIVIKFAHSSPVDPYEQPTSAEAAVFEYLVNKLTAGRVQVKSYPNSSLGDQVATLQQTRKGTIEMTNVASGVLASAMYEPLSLFDIPYLFKSTAVAWELTRLDNPFTKRVVEEVREKTGLRIIGIQPMGFRHFTNDVRPIKEPKDLKGLKIRTMQVKPHIKMVEAMGGLPTPIPFSELYTSLQTGVVDGQENATMNIMAQHFDEVQKYMTLDGHVLLLAITMVNDKWFSSLPEDIQAKILEAEDGARTAATGLNFIKDATGLKELKKRGMEIYSPTAEEMNKFKEATQKPVIEYLKGKIDQEYFDLLFAEIEKIETKLGY